MTNAVCNVLHFELGPFSTCVTSHSYGPSAKIIVHSCFVVSYVIVREGFRSENR